MKPRLTNRAPHPPVEVATETIAAIQRAVAAGSLGEPAETSVAGFYLTIRTRDLELTLNCRAVSPDFSLDVLCTEIRGQLKAHRLKTMAKGMPKGVG